MPKKRRVRTTFKEEIEPQEILVDKLAKKRAEETLMPEEKLEVLLPRRATLVLCFLFFIIFTVLFARTLYLQIVLGENLSELALKNYQKIYLTRSVRGVIYDTSGQQLVFNRPSFDLVYFQSFLALEKEKKEAVLEQVSEIIGKDVAEIKKRIEESQSDPILIDGDLSHETLILLETRINELPGFKIEKNTTREYLEGQFFSHVLGFCGRIDEDEIAYLEGYSPTDYVGKTGVEGFYESILRGRAGGLKIEKDVMGTQLSSEKISDPEAGKSLVLWLDTELQKKIVEELEKSLQRIGSEKAAAVAIDPKTGGILAMVSIPSFDNNLFSRVASEEEVNEVFNNPLAPLFNRAMSGIGYPTGSTIKPLVAVAALEENIVSPQKNILCEGLISVENPYWPDIEPEEYTYHDWKVHGWTDIYKAIAESCNVYFYTVGGGYEGFEGLGAERIEKYVELFGWGKKTGVDLPEEGKGILPKIDKDWRLGDTYHLSIGQGAFAITPLQVANAFAAIANGGILYKPRVVKQIIKGSPNTPEEIEKVGAVVIREGFVDEKNLQIVRQGMRKAVTSPSGSTHVFNDLPVSSAAKTGTAQTGIPDYNHAWVTVFAPFEAPEIVLTIIVENVEEGQIATLPVAKEILNWYFTRSDEQ